MSWLSRFINGLRASRVDADLDEELRFHYDARVDELIASGVSRQEAEAAVSRRFGNPLLLREKSRDVKLLPWLESIVKDARFGGRALRRNAAVYGAAILSLSLTIGACVAAFALVDALILRPLPVPDPARLVYLTFLDETFTTDTGGPVERDTFSYPLFERFRESAAARCDLFAVGYASGRSVVLARGAEEKARVQLISGNAFAVLGVKAAAGRLLAPADDVVGAPAVAVLSHSFWVRRFGADWSVVGRTLMHDEQSFEIVGVLDPSFHGVEPGLLVDIWMPASIQKSHILTSAGQHWIRIFGRLTPSVGRDQVRRALQTTFTTFRRDRARLAFRVGEPRDRVERYVAAVLMLQSGARGLSALRRSFERPLWILATIVALVLLIAGSNVANLFLARAAARQHEMSLRLSIGADRHRLVQQILVECGLVVGIACSLALPFALASAPAVVRMLAPAESPAYLDLHLSWRLITFLAVIALATAALFGLGPTVRAARAEPIDALKAAGQHGASRALLLRPVVALQAAFSVAVLFIGGLLLLSFAKLTNIDLGFNKSGLLLVDVEARELEDSRQAHTAGVQLLAHARRLAQVDRASLASWPLFGGMGWTNNIRIPGQPPDATEPHYLAVAPDFFETMGIPLLEGRAIEAADTQIESSPAVVVNDAFAQRYFGGRALGRTFWRVDSVLAEQRIVGVAGNAKYRDVRAPAPPTVYVPLRGLGTLHVRASDPGFIAAALRRDVPTIHPALRVTDVRLQSTLIENQILRERLLALLSGFFACVGLLLAVIGLYGVLSYAVVLRTREIGIRMALGARPRAVVGSVVGHIAVAVGLGIVAGLAGGVYVARLVTPLLFQVEPLDFLSLALPLAVLLAAGILAALPPARRATHVDPVVALRYE